MEALLDRLVALELGRNGTVAHLVETPAPGRHAACEAVEVIAGKGFAGDHARKSFYRGQYVPGREVSAMSREVLHVLGVEHLVVGDNLITEGLDLAALRPGDVVRAGREVVLVRSDRTHRPCTVFRDRASPAAYEAVRVAPYRGALFVVRRGGTLRLGDALRVEP